MDRRIRIVRFDKLFPIHVGIIPDKSYSPRSINNNPVQFFKVEGISPMKLLLLNFNDRILLKEPIEVEMLPDNLLFVKLRISKF